MKTTDPCISIGGPGCGIKKVLNIIGGKWKILILCLMNEKHKMRYGEIRNSVIGITNTMLAQSLKEMEKDGLIDRHQYNEMPVRVEYSLTPKALSLVPILMNLKDWGIKNL